MSKHRPLEYAALDDGPTYGTEHPHEPEIPPALDPDGRCLICGMEVRIEDLEAALKRATFLAEHLMQMITPEQWRDTGGDDGQGHYEGDYHAEATFTEIRELAAIAALPAASAEG